MLIRNFGHLWERKYINWGRPNVRGHLKGYRSKTHEVDFRDQIGIYVLFDKDLLPVYIGQAGRNHRLFGRLKEHETDHLWNRWEHFSWFGLRRVDAKLHLSAYDNVNKIFRAPGSLLLNQIEGALITAMEPKLNKQGARWKDVEEYFQLIDEEMEEVTAGDILDSNDKLEKLIAGLSKNLTKRKKI
jgi:hypothetical protein